LDEWRLVKWDRMGAVPFPACNFFIFGQVKPIVLEKGTSEPQGVTPLPKLYGVTFRGVLFLFMLSMDFLTSL
jgi:hypothetical protein